MKFSKQIHYLKQIRKVIKNINIAPSIEIVGKIAPLK